MFSIAPPPRRCTDYRKAADFSSLEKPRESIGAGSLRLAEKNWLPQASAIDWIGKGRANVCSVIDWLLAWKFKFGAQLDNNPLRDNMRALLLAQWTPNVVPRGTSAPTPDSSYLVMLVVSASSTATFSAASKVPSAVSVIGIWPPQWPYWRQIDLQQGSAAKSLWLYWWACREPENNRAATIHCC